MYTSEHIDALDIEELRANFFGLMGEVVVAYGDDGQLVSCPGQQQGAVSLPGLEEQFVQVVSSLEEE